MSEFFNQTPEEPTNTNESEIPPVGDMTFGEWVDLLVAKGILTDNEF